MGDSAGNAEFDEDASPSATSMMAVTIEYFANGKTRLAECEMSPTLLSCVGHNQHLEVDS